MVELDYLEYAGRRGLHNREGDPALAEAQDALWQADEALWHFARAHTGSGNLDGLGPRFWDRLLWAAISFREGVNPLPQMRRWFPALRFRCQDRGTGRSPVPAIPTGTVAFRIPSGRRVSGRLLCEQPRLLIISWG